MAVLSLRGCERDEVGGQELLSPNDIENKEFKKSKIGGYLQSDVDDFIMKIVRDYKKMYSENAELLKKIDALINKIEEYRAEQDSVNDAVIKAQKQGGNIIEEANIQAEVILNQAKKKAEDIIGESKELYRIEKSDVDAELAAFNQLKSEISNFRLSILEQYRSHINSIELLPHIEIKKKDTKDNNEDKDIKISELKFGTNYDIARDDDKIKPKREKIRRAK